MSNEVMAIEPSAAIQVRPIARGADLMVLPSHDELEYMKLVANTAAKSRRYSDFGDESGILMMMLLAKELSVPYALAINQGFNCIKGRIEMSARLMNMRIRQFGHTFNIDKLDRTECVLTGTRGDTGETYQCVYTIEDARLAELLTPNSGWLKTPTDKLFAACLRALCRRLFPEVLGTADAPGEAIEISGYEGERKTHEPRGRQRKQQTVVPPAAQATQTAKAETVDVEAIVVNVDDTDEEAEARKAETQDQNTESESFVPDPKIIETLTLIHRYLDESFNIEPDGKHHTNRLLRQRFQVEEPEQIPAERYEELRSFCRVELLDELERAGWIERRQNH